MNPNQNSQRNTKPPKQALIAGKETPKMDQLKIGEFISKKRKELGLTQNQLAWQFTFPIEGQAYFPFIIFFS